MKRLFLECRIMPYCRPMQTHVAVQRPLDLIRMDVDTLLNAIWILNHVLRTPKNRRDVWVCDHGTPRVLLLKSDAVISLQSKPTESTSLST